METGFHGTLRAKETPMNVFNAAAK